MAYSAGFTPHPKISYVGAAPTGVASEAEYLEIGLARRVDLADLRARLDGALPDGLDLMETVEAGLGSLADRVEASAWRVELVELAADDMRGLVQGFLARTDLPVQRRTKDGPRTIDTRAAVVSMRVDVPSAGGRAILDLVVRQVTPAVRPDDIIAALRTVAGLAHDVPPWTYRAVRLAQGPLDESGAVGDPLAADRPERDSL
jgi:radical SAM-linked protein